MDNEVLSSGTSPSPRSEPERSPELTAPLQPISLTLKPLVEEGRNGIFMNATELRHGDRIILNDVELSVRFLEPRSLVFPQRVPESGEDKIKFAFDETPPGLRLQLVDSRERIRFETQGGYPAIFHVTAEGQVFNNTALIQAARMPQGFERVCVAVNLAADKVQPLADSYTLNRDELSLDHFCSYVGTESWNWDSDGPVVRHGKETKEVVPVTIRPKTFAFKHVDTTTAQVAGVAGFTGSPELEAQHPRDFFPMIYNGNRGRGNQEARIDQLYFTSAANKSLLANRLLQNIYGPGANDKFIDAFRSLADAHEFLASTFTINPDPKQGDKMLLSFKEPVVLTDHFKIRTPMDDMGAQENILTRLLVQDPEKRRISNENSQLGPAMPWVFMKGEEIVVSLYPGVIQEVQFPEVVQRLLDAYGASLFEPWFGPSQRLLKETLASDKAAALYFSQSRDFLVLRPREENGNVHLYSRIKQGQQSAEESSSTILHKYSSNFYEEINLISFIRPCGSRYFEDHAHWSIYQNFVSHSADPKKHFDNFRDAVIAECSPLQKHSLDRWPETQEVERREDGWFVTNRDSYLSRRITEPQKIGELEDGVVVSLVCEDFRDNVFHLDGSGKIGGLTWALPPSADESGKAVSMADAGIFIPNEDQMFRGNSMGIVLKDGDPIHIDGERALLILKPGETKNFLIAVSSRFLVHSDQPSVPDVTLDPLELIRAAMNNDAASSIVVGFSATRGEDGKVVRFKPYNNGHTYECGKGGLPANVVIRLS